MPQKFRQPKDSTPLRAQRMTADESRAVIALWQQEQIETTGPTDKPALPDVAEGLGVSVEDVQRLLTEVRASRVEEGALAAHQKLSEMRLAEEQRKLAEVRRQRPEAERRQQIRPLHSPHRSPATRLVLAFGKALVLTLTLGGFVVAPLLYLLWCVFTGPH